jgi:hypothetical protein
LRLGLVAVLVLSACTSKITLQTVRTQAARDLECDEGSVTVVRVDEAKKLYQASGCGHRKSYVCDKWNSYDQAPVCHDAAE